MGLELSLKGWVEVGKVERGKGVGGGENGQGQRCGAMRSRARTEVKQGELGCHMHRGAWRNKPENEPLLKLCTQALSSPHLSPGPDEKDGPFRDPNQEHFILKAMGSY